MDGTRPAAPTAAAHTATNYDKWDMLDLSDDEDVSDCHPNIDGKLWLRLKKEKQHRKWEEEDAELAQLPGGARTVTLKGIMPRSSLT